MHVIKSLFHSFLATLVLNSYSFFLFIYLFYIPSFLSQLWDPLDCWWVLWGGTLWNRDKGRVSGAGLGREAGRAGCLSSRTLSSWAGGDAFMNF